MTVMAFHEQSAPPAAPAPHGAACRPRPEGSARPVPLPGALGALGRSILRSLALLARGRIRQPMANRGRRVDFADGTAAVVYRETVIAGACPRRPAVLVVAFRLRRVHQRWGHALFRAESALNTVLFAGFAGLVSKLWLADDEQGRYRGLYQWDGAEEAVAYVGALWWALAVVSEPASIRFAVLPGLDRDAVLADPALLEAVAGPASGWWRPTGATPGTGAGR